MGNFIQYELWKDCRNHCKFCYNYGQSDKYSKTKSLDYFLEKLDDPEVDNLADEETDQVLMEVAGIKMQGRLIIDIDIRNRFSRC